MKLPIQRSFRTMARPVGTSRLSRRYTQYKMSLRRASNPDDDDIIRPQDISYTTDTVHFPRSPPTIDFFAEPQIKRNVKLPSIQVSTGKLSTPGSHTSSENGHAHSSNPAGGAADVSDFGAGQNSDTSTSSGSVTSRSSKSNASAGKRKSSQSASVDNGLHFDFQNNSISGSSSRKKYDELPLQDPTRVKLFSYHELTYTGPFFVGAPSGGNGGGHGKMDFLKSMVYDTGSEMCWAFDGANTVTCCPDAGCDPQRKRVTGCAAKSKSWFSWGSDGSNHCPATFTPFKHGAVGDEFVVCYGRGFAKGRKSNSMVSFSKQQQGISFPFGVGQRNVIFVKIHFKILI